MPRAAADQYKGDWIAILSLVHQLALSQFSVCHCSFGLQEPEHRMSVPLVDAALALMRLSTEKFFVLLSLFVTFLVFRIPPQSAAYLIRLNARISSAFARLIVYSFPAVCWSYGAGFVFSTFVSGQ